MQSYEIRCAFYGCLSGLVVATVLIGVLTPLPWILALWNGLIAVISLYISFPLIVSFLPRKLTRTDKPHFTQGGAV